MISRRVVLVGALFGLLSCRTSSVAPEPSRLLLISFDGIAADYIEPRLIGREELPAMRAMAAVGVVARVVPVNPTLTSPAHISIATGAPPSLTGIVSNTFHSPGTPRLQSTRGFSAPIGVETLWEAAQRQGKKVGVITFPGADGNGPARTADWGLAYTDPIESSRLLRLRRANFGPHSRTSLPSFSPVLSTPLSWEFTVEGKATRRSVEVIVLDTTNDAVENYDAVRIEADGHEVPLDAKRWFPLSASLSTADGTRLYGSWSKILKLDPKLRDVRIYLGPISSTVGYPASYREMIDREIGFWPGPPDEDFSADWLEKREGVDPQTFTEQMERFSSFFTQVTLLSMKTMPWDLILTYQPIVDETEHQYRLVNERQQWSTPENRREAERVRTETYRAVDRSVEAFRKALPRGASFIVTGDHGLEALDTSVRVNRLLIDWGFAQKDQEIERLSPQTRWAAFTSGSQSHIYAFEKRDGETEALITRLRELRAPDGQLVFEEVRARGADDHPNSGDVVAYAYPRFGMSSSIGGDTFSKTRSFGQHGGLNHHRGYHTIYLATGPKIQPQASPLSQTLIAAIASGILGIEPPQDAEQFGGD